MDKTNLILNSTIELVDVQEEGNGKGRPFVSRFIEPGIAHYKELGDILITKETLNKFINTMVGCPVIIEHEDVTDANADKLRVGVVSRVWFNEMDGYFYCEGILTDPEAIYLVKNQGYNVSCAYSFVSDNTKRTHNGKEIDMEFINGEFLHLALVKDPRYEGANIVVNKNDDDLEWITVKDNHIPVKKGQSKEEAVKKFLEEKQEKSEKKDKQGSESKEEKKYNDYFNIQTTGMSKYDDVLKDEKYAERKKRIPEIVEMTPDEYIEKCLDGFNQERKKENSPLISKKELIESRTDSSLESLEKSFKENKIDTPVIEYGLKENGDIEMDSQEGLHRAIIAKKLGIKKIPVVVVVSEGYKQKVEIEKIKQKLDEINKNFNKVNNSADKENIIMQVLDELKNFILGVVHNEKEEEMKEVKNEDKRKLIDEVGGILKDKVDEELWKTVVGKLEKIAYEPSEDDKADNKAKNEDDEEKEAKNKCKNEEAKEDVTKNEDKPEDGGEDDEEDKPEDKAENKKVKNSMKDMVMGGSSNVQEQKLYISRKERLEEGNRY